MKKGTLGNAHRSALNSYRSKSDNMSGENWFSDHKKLLWGIGGAVVLGAGAMLILKKKNEKNDEELNNDFFDQLNELHENELIVPVQEELIIATITEID